MRPDSLDLRERVAAAIAPHDGSIRWIARVFRVSTAFLVRRLPRRRATGTRAPAPHRGGPPPALGPADLERRAALVRAPPDATREPLRPRGGFPGSRKTRWSVRDRLGLTRTKKSRPATPRDRPEVRTKRRRFRRAVGQSEPKTLVFVAETGVTTARTPADARTPRGQRVVDSTPASWGRSR